MREKEIKTFQNAMWFYWSGSDDPEVAPPCLVCWSPSVCLHEIEPRSTYREWYKTLPNINSIPLCHSCHRDAEEGRLEKAFLAQLSLDRSRDLWYNEPPERVSKSAKPKMGVDGRSVFTIDKEIRKK